ncbi:MAG TPA: hypothetical protein VIA62_13110 [Thermoanaerobaculia bacterium]|jgi:hypothetical protein|nr:hypothetical protein [Thermoanaerobaculia bacterium]
MTSPAPPARDSSRSDLFHLGGACLVLVLGIWANSGTLNPLAVTLDHPLVWEPCKYLLNIDHFHHKATFLMLDGAPRESWRFSVVLRRILYPLVTYPFMKLLGFEYGGILVNVLLVLGSVAAFWYAARRRFPSGFSRAALWLLAAYPGFFYWASSPYGYATIVPLSLLSLVLLWRLQDVATWQGALLHGLVLGVLFTAYDLVLFFGVAGVLLLLHRRLWRASAAFAVAQLLPQVLALTVLYEVFDVPLRNANSEIYGVIVGSYLSRIDGRTWSLLLAKVPGALVDNYLYGNFLFLPLLFTLGLWLATRTPGERPALEPAERCVLLAALLLFLFTNLAPPYHGWQMRGSWISRLYQPMGVVMVAFLGRLYAHARQLPRPLRLAAGSALALAVALNLWVVFSPLFAPVLGSPLLSAALYRGFYLHNKQTWSYVDNLKRYGSRPLGFCASPPSSAATVTH